MQFTSTKTIKGQKITSSFGFDPALVYGAKREVDQDVFTINIATAGLGNPTALPFKTKYTTLVLRTTADNVYINALCCVDYDDESVKPYRAYMEDDIISFSVQMEEIERRRILLILLKHLA